MNVWSLNSLSDVQLQHSTAFIAPCNFIVKSSTLICSLLLLSFSFINTQDIKNLALRSPTNQYNVCLYTQIRLDGDQTGLGSTIFFPNSTPTQFIRSFHFHRMTLYVYSWKANILVYLHLAFAEIST